MEGIGGGGGGYTAAHWNMVAFGKRYCDIIFASDTMITTSSLVFEKALPLTGWHSLLDMKRDR